jgi:hypothetical protein
VIVILFVLSILALHSAIDDLRFAKSKEHILASYIVLLNGIATGASAYGVFKRTNWLRISLTMMALFCFLSAGLATLIYGETTLTIAVLSALSTLIVTVPLILVTMKFLT